jgi:ABC-type Mn2+/Zn2+ transport system ATPase subunit
LTVLVRLANASFGYGRKPVLANVDLEIAPGDLIGIVGPNGAGKTTLFRGILGLVPPLAGTVELGTDAVGYVPQRESLDPIFPLTVEEVVRMGGYGRLRGPLRRVPPGDRELVERCLERVELVRQRRELFASLSGGQRQRALLARALMSRPRLLLLDEPTSGVDHAAEERILALLRKLREEGLAVLLVSHQLGLVREAARDALWVADGRVARGPADEILAPDALDALFARRGGDR